MATSTSKISTKQMTLIGVMTAVTCILAPISLPIPVSPVPISLTNLVINFSCYILGWKAATISYLIYLLIGLVGLPVFSGFSGGLGKLAGPTGGYLIGFIFLAIVAGIMIERFPKNYLMQALGLVIGTGICYVFGTAWLAKQLGMTFGAGLGVGVIPYLPGDAVKIILALLAGPMIRTRIQRAIG